jgi:hypothetical protein
MWLAFYVLASATLNSMLHDKWRIGKQHLQQLVVSCRRLTICLDGWSKKGLSSSYLGISACFYDNASAVVRHVTLDLKLLHHPHTGEQIATVLNECLSEWGINPQKILLVVTDNGSNVVKAIRLFSEMHTEVAISEEITDESSSSQDESDEGEHGDNAGLDADEEPNQNAMDDMNLAFQNIDLPTPTDISCRRMQCMAHTLQLVVKKVYDHYHTVIKKAHYLVCKIRKSSVATQMLISKCGKTVICDNATRWNSTYMMAQRLIEIKSAVNEVLSSIMIDSLLVDEWSRLDELTKLLAPFASQTDILQTDSMSLSSVIPSLLDLQCHLQQFPQPKSLTRALLVDIRERFGSVLSPTFPEFNPVPAAACLLDPSLAAVLFTPDGNALIEPAKQFILREVIQATTNKVYKMIPFFCLFVCLISCRSGIQISSILI